MANIGEHSNGLTNDTFGSFTSGYCLINQDIHDTGSPFSYLLLALAIIDFIALLVMIVFVWLESLEKQAYKKAKGKPVKLLLTQDYLAQLRPQKRPVPAPSPTDADLQSTVV